MNLYNMMLAYLLTIIYSMLESIRRLNAIKSVVMNYHNTGYSTSIMLAAFALMKQGKIVIVVVGDKSECRRLPLRFSDYAHLNNLTDILSGWKWEAITCTFYDNASTGKIYMVALDDLQAKMRGRIGGVLLFDNFVWWQI